MATSLSLFLFQSKSDQKKLKITYYVLNKVELKF
jgi:hypothetical protein